MKGSIKQRGKDPKKWTLVFDGPRDAAGKRKQQRVSFEGTFRNAQAHLRKLCAEVDEGRYISSRETVAEYLVPSVLAQTHQRHGDGRVRRGRRPRAQ